MKTLLVKYTPREERSSSKKLLDAFRNEIKNSEIEILDLCVDVPDMFNVKSMTAYIKQNYLKEELLAEQKVTLDKMDRMTQQLKSSDIVVVAFPMHNFSMPASVKAWFDSVMLKGQTWDNSDGKYFGLLKEKKGTNNNFFRRILHQRTHDRLGTCHVACQNRVSIHGIFRYTWNFGRRHECGK